MTNQIKLRNNAYKNVIKTKYGFQITIKKPVHESSHTGLHLLTNIYYMKRLN